MTVYLDHNATTPVRPEATEAVAAALTATGNPSSVHGAGRRARMLVEDAREQVAALVGARAEDVIFTSGGTEANNLALANAPQGGAEGPVFASAVEHVSVLDGTDNVIQVPVDGDGVVDLAELNTCLKDALNRVEGGRALVSVMLANNETGVIQPIARIAELAAEYDAVFHCDAVQAAGKLAIDFPTLGAHMMTLSAHKIGGPPGVGALIVAPGHQATAAIRGGGQERSRRGGTENVPGIAGFGRAAEAAKADIDRLQGLITLRDRMEAEITAAVPDAKIFAKDRDRLATTSCLTMPGVSSETQVMAFDLAGIAVSAGAACSSGKVAPSHVLAAMGVDEDDLKSAIRVSLGWTTTTDDIDTFTAAWTGLHARIGGGSLAA
ncbi:MAG TPA: cysteine desulfurase [Rhodospirillaceae bacterium]|nr:cysteine desulfurase [Magnetovibrio sp.]HCS71219.1 cysteine desulfurase [Rhodospirillaceae bacterium]|tara:strand:+ start:6634 stop:7773 length:1140 start_codon:yes stop_codon:yes gene_type:complete